MSHDEELIEKAAKALFGEEQCDRRQMLDLDGNWESRLNDQDQEDYRALARAVLPLIEADLRERIAQEIEASASINECVEGSKTNDYRTGLLTAAALVRGTPTTDTGNNES